MIAMKRLTKGTAGIVVAVLLVAAAAGSVGTAVAQEQTSNEGVDYYLVAPDHTNVSEETEVTIAVYFRDPSSTGVTVDTELAFYVDGELADSETGTAAVEQGTWSNTSFTHTFDGDGTYDLRIRSEAFFAGQPVSDVNVSGPIAVGNASLDDGAMDGDGDGTDGDGDGADGDDGTDGDDGDGAMDGDGDGDDGDGAGDDGDGGDGGDGLIPQPGFTVVVALAAFLVLVAAHRFRQ